MYDTTILGEASSLEELSDYLKEYDSEWTIGAEGSSEWSDGILKSKPHLYSLGHNKSEVYNSRFAAIMCDIHSFTI